MVATLTSPTPRDAWPGWLNWACTLLAQVSLEERREPALALPSCLVAQGKLGIPSFSFFLPLSPSFSLFLLFSFFATIPNPNPNPNSKREQVKPIFQAIAAKVDGEPCCDYVGEDGSGHYVKMVHNGIEYGDMQLLCEAYHLLKDALGMTSQEMSEVFTQWNKEELDSFLVEITANVLAFKNPDGSHLVEQIRDTAGQVSSPLLSSPLSSSLQLSALLSLIIPSLSFFLS